MCIIPKLNAVTIKLAEAKQLVEDGWCQNLFVTYKSEERFNYCAIGAMHSTSSPLSIFIFGKMVDTFIAANGLPSSDDLMGKTTNITSWNDTKGRTKEEVLAAFDKAINYVG